MVETRQAEIDRLLGEISSVAEMGYMFAFHVHITPTAQYHTYPLEWTNEYSQNTLFVVDPCVSWAYKSTGSIRWRDIKLHRDSDVAKSAAVHGLNYGAAFSTGSFSSRSLGHMAHHDREFSDTEIEFVHERFQRIHALFTPPALGATDKEIITALSEGVTPKIDGLSQKKLDETIAHLKDEFVVRTEKELCQRAIDYKLI